MIGIPERLAARKGKLYAEGPKPGWRVRTLLMPTVYPGDMVRIKSDRASLDGVFEVKNIQHEGDTHEGNFLSEIEAFTK